MTNHIIYYQVKHGYLSSVRLCSVRRQPPIVMSARGPPWVPNRCPDYGDRGPGPRRRAVRTDPPARYPILGLRVRTLAWHSAQKSLDAVRITGVYRPPSCRNFQGSYPCPTFHALGSSHLLPRPNSNRIRPSGAQPLRPLQITPQRGTTFATNLLPNLGHS